ncbi:hypothetical protein GN958_ATG14492 [Phytophthora infestans]|uniref:Uncharacterized protein n=1 Tax=Phytophthora infestans TaxID=4787 RepID=A0A8S9U715_PHYIN|nr:hypothetical protein GN958_ATG14492 [Phytophthora infestans]
MCAAREKRRAERIADGGTPTWRHIWSQLKASGWKHKKPPASSIETRWKFIPPGGKANGIEGKDYFLGEDRVCAHYASVLVYVSSFNGSSRSAELGVIRKSLSNVPVPLAVEELQATSQVSTESTAAGRCDSPPRLSASSSPMNGMYSQRVYLDCLTYWCMACGADDRGGIFSSEDEDDEYELVPRDRVVRSSPTVHTSIKTSLFGSSDEDDSDDEVAIDEGEVVIVDDDNGDSDYEDGASFCILYIQLTLTLSNM